MQKIRLSVAFFFIVVLVACSGNPSERVTVVIEPELLQTTLGISGDLTAAGAEKQNLASASFDGQAFSYFSDQLIIKVPNDKALDKFLKQFGGILLNDGAIPAPDALLTRKRLESSMTWATD
jgi:hypothetical protein